MTKIQTSILPFCVCEFMMVLSSRLSTQKNHELQKQDSILFHSFL